MEKLYVVKHELHGKVHVAYVRATSELGALMEARTAAKDSCNVSHVISISLA